MVGVVRGTGRLPGRLAHWLLDPLARRPVRALRWLVAGVVAGLVLAAAAVAGVAIGSVRRDWRWPWPRGGERPGLVREVL